MKQVDTMPAVVPRRRRRQHSVEFKAEVVRACCAPGVSVAGIARAYGLNASLVRRWLIERGVRPERRRSDGPSEVPALRPTREFVPVTVAAARAADICIEVRRGGATITVNWPLQSAHECAAWLRQWLR